MGISGGPEDLMEVVGGLRAASGDLRNLGSSRWSQGVPRGLQAFLGASVAL